MLAFGADTGLFGHSVSRLLLLRIFCLSLGHGQIETEKLSQSLRAVNPKQPANQSLLLAHAMMMYFIQCH